MFPILTGLPAHPSLFLPPCPTQAGVLAAFGNCGLEGEALQPPNQGHFRQRLPSPEPCLGPWDLGTYPQGIRLFPARRQGCLGRGRCEDGAAAHLGSAVLRIECRGLFVPGLTAQNWGAPASASHRKLLPVLVRSLPPSGPPSAAGIVFVAAAAPKKF